MTIGPVGVFSFAVPEIIIFYIYIGLVLLLAGGAILFVFMRRLAKRDEVWRSLNLRLFRIALPRPSEPEGGHNLDQIRERIGAMEKIYANFQGIREPWWRVLVYGKPSFALEITVPHIGEAISFYLAVPRRLAVTSEKIVEGVFPEARVEPVNDYNIFNPEGESVGAVLTLKLSSTVPIRTYRQLETDPLKELANAFSKLERIGEGASLQVVARPASKKWQRRMASHAKLVYQGKATVIPKGMVREGFDILTGSSREHSKQKNESAKPELEHRLSPKEEEQVRLIEAKGSKALFETNIRIVASAKTKNRAEEILMSIVGAFSQFRDPGLNEFRVKHVSGRQLERTFYYFSFRVFDEWNSSILGSEELSSIFHFPNVTLETPKLEVVKARSQAPPVNLPEQGILVGRSVFRGETQEIRITDDDRRRHVYTIGQTGTGKSVLMTEMVRQDILAGRGVCFIDPHGDTVEEILGFVPPERLRDVVYFNPSDIERPLGLNMLEYDPRFPEQKTFVVNELFAIFQKLYGAVPESMGPMFEQYFRNATLLVLDDPASGSTMLEIERVFVDREFRDLKLSRSSNIVVKTFWKDIAERAGGDASLQNMVPYITSKFDTFLANEIMRPVIAQEHSAFNFREVMDQQKILLINLSKGRLGEINSSLIGLVMVSKLLMAALSRVDSSESERKDFYLYIDEFQNVTTRSIATILSEARKYRLNLIIAHQFLGQLEEEIRKAVFGNVGCVVAFRIGADDAEFMATQFQPVFGAQDLLNLDNHHAYVKLLIRGATAPPFNMETFPPKGRDPVIAADIRTLSRMIYGRPRAEVEEEIRQRYL